MTRERLVAQRGLPWIVLICLLLLGLGRQASAQIGGASGRKRCVCNGPNDNHQLETRLTVDDKSEGAPDQLTIFNENRPGNAFEDDVKVTFSVFGGPVGDSCPCGSVSVDIPPVPRKVYQVGGFTDGVCRKTTAPPSGGTPVGHCITCRWVRDTSGGCNVP